MALCEESPADGPQRPDPCSAVELAWLSDSLSVLHQSRPTFEGDTVSLYRHKVRRHPFGGERLSSASPCRRLRLLAMFRRDTLATLGLGLGQNLSGNSNLLPRTSRARHDRRLGHIGDLTDRFCPGPSTLRWTLLPG